MISKTITWTVRLVMGGLALICWAVFAMNLEVILTSDVSNQHRSMTLIMFIISLLVSLGVFVRAEHVTGEHKS